MPPRLTLYRTAQSFCLRSRPLRRSFVPLVPRFSQQRTFADSKNSEISKGPNEDVLPHVSEEAAKTSEITGDGGPEMDQGTPISEVCDTSRAKLSRKSFTWTESIN